MKVVLIYIWLVCMILDGGNAGLPDEHSSRHRVRRVVGGRDATPGEWPWMGSLRSADDIPVCGAILISERAAITAAHCRAAKYPPVSVVFGVTDLKNPGTRRSFEFVSHPDYNSTTEENDIALLWFDEPVQAVRDVMEPAILSHSKTEHMTHGNCTITGWGRVNEDPEEYPYVLQAGNVDLFSQQECASKKRFDGTIMLCAGLKQGGVDTCVGDSGEPLQCRWNSGGAYEVVGITSFSDEGDTGLCGQSNNSVVYTRISSYTAFLSQTHGNEHTVYFVVCVSVAVGILMIVFSALVIGHRRHSREKRNVNNKEETAGNRMVSNGNNKPEGRQQEAQMYELLS